MADNTELQEPEKVENSKKKKATGDKQGMSLTTVIILLLSVVVVQAVLFILIYKFVLKTPEGDEHSNGKSKTEKKGEANPMPNKISNIDLQEQEFIAGEENRDFIETDRITTNPLNSAKYVAIKVYLEYRVHPSLMEVLPESDKAEEKLKKEGPYMQKIMANVKAIVIEQVGKMTEPEILGNKEKLRKNIEKSLKELFASKKIFLRDAKFTEFIIT